MKRGRNPVAWKPDVASECEALVASLARDASFRPFAGPDAALIVIGEGDADVLWASEPAGPLAEAVSADADLRARLLALVRRAPRDGLRLERLRLPGPVRIAPATFAVRGVALNGRDGALLALVSGEAAPARAVLPPAGGGSPAGARPSTGPERARPPALRGGEPRRFTWATDASGRFTAVSRALAEVVGPAGADLLGRSWAEVDGILFVDEDERLAAALGRAASFRGVMVRWRIADSELAVPVELGAIPVLDRGGAPAGFRGFGLCRLSAVGPDPDSLGAPVRAARPPASPPPGPVATALSPGLSVQERSALHEIARALGARMPDGDEPPAPPRRPSAEIVALPPPRSDGERHGLLDKLPVGIVVLRDGVPVLANRFFLDLLGHEDVAGLVSRSALPPGFGDEAGPAGRETLVLQARSGGPVPCTVEGSTIRWGEGSARLVLVRPAPERAAPSAPGARAAGEAAAIERAGWQRRLDGLAAALDAAADGVVGLDRRGRILSLTRAAERLFGVTANEVAGESLATLLAPASHPAALPLLETSAAAAEPRSLAVEGRGPGGETIRLRMRIAPCSGPEGGSLLAAFSREPGPDPKDATEIAVREAVEAAEHRHLDYLARVSHEIRTPLNAIMGFAELMLAERFGPVGQERYRGYLRDILDSGGHMLGLVNDVLSLARATAGRAELEPASLDLNGLALGGVALTELLAARERAVVRTSLRPGLPAARADARAIRQVILNLLSNAIRFTGAGGQVIVSTDLAGPDSVVLRIRDTGPGLTPEEVELAMVPFRQLGGSKREDGTGLGLPLSKALVEANGGSFSIRAAPRGAGSLVEVRLPLAPPDATGPGRDDPYGPYDTPGAA